MIETTKIVRGTQRGYDKEIENRKSKGWTVEREVVNPRSVSRNVYIAYLKREKS